MNTSSLQQALERYHAAYDNNTYTHIRRHVITDINGTTTDYIAHEGDTNVVDIMNALADTCLECCGAEQRQTAHIQLAKLAAWSELSDETLNTIYRYLTTFQQAGNTAAEDFLGTASALLHASAGEREVGIATAFANGVHGWRGRMAYELLAASDYLLKAAELLLQHHADQAYIREKLRYALSRITSALYEGVRHSDCPALFDFNSIYFPTEKDGR